ncbi:MAG TPA: hypothetical protein VJ868_09470 [Actinomycetota bacterium]|jgi:hypothetical protein|nr:hypothetical protein [Actinomycetota bacterium]
MRKTIALGIGLAAAMGILLPGSAQAGNTTVDAVVAGGALTISAQPASATLTGAQFNQALGSQATGQFGSVTVSDGRGLPTPWTLTASSTNFVGVADPSKSVVLSPSSSLQFGAVANPTVAPSALAGTCTVGGGNLTAPNSGVAIASGVNLLTQLNPVTCTFNPNLTLNVPANTPPQTYRATVTLTAA